MNTTVTDDMAADYRKQPADELAAAGLLKDPAWRRAWQSVLDVHDGHKVLEIGTGTGYNAALLAHRLGPDNVTTIDVDPRLTKAAKEVLDNAGFPVTVLTGNGAHRAAECAPFDRIIATCGVDRIPAAWIQQLAPGGLIVANVSRGLIALRRGNGDMVSGRFCGQAGFMALHTEGELPTPTSGRVSRLPAASRNGSTTLTYQGA